MQTVLPTAHHRCDNTSERAGRNVVAWRNDPEIGAANSIHAFGVIEGESKRFDFASQRDKRLIRIVCLMEGVQPLYDCV